MFCVCVKVQLVRYGEEESHRNLRLPVYTTTLLILHPPEYSGLFNALFFCSPLCSTESVYDLLPKELQLPPSRETSVASMSQTSGGEAGSPPPAVVAAGKCSQFSLFSHLFSHIFIPGFASEAGSVCIKNDL
uniref:Uncharacterized protein n=1 Tax=Nothoprocta perdicaria TaxID=30464 RepID=A0A8C6Z1H4_NOTPE